MNPSTTTNSSLTKELLQPQGQLLQKLATNICLIGQLCRYSV